METNATQLRAVYFEGLVPPIQVMCYLHYVYAESEPRLSKNQATTTTLN